VKYYDILMKQFDRLNEIKDKKSATTGLMDDDDDDTAFNIDAFMKAEGIEV